MLRFIEKRQLSWLGDTDRIGPNHSIKEIWETRPPIHSGRGRPKQMCNEEILIYNEKSWRISQYSDDLATPKG